MSANWVKVKLDRGRVSDLSETRMDIKEVLAVLYSQTEVEGMVHRDSLATALVKLYKEAS